MQNDEFVTFENNYVQNRTELAYQNPEAFGCVTIDGFPANEDGEGSVICQVWMSLHKDIIVSWHHNGYRMNETVLDLVEKSKSVLYDMWNEQHEDPSALCTITVYPYIEFADDTAVICKYSGEHSGGISDRLPMDVCKMAADGYRKMGMKPVTWRPVSKADYDAFVQKHPDSSSVNVEWDKDGTFTASTENNGAGAPS